jgi:hypothetical protein
MSGSCVSKPDKHDWAGDSKAQETERRTALAAINHLHLVVGVYINRPRWYRPWRRWKAVP